MGAGFGCEHDVPLTVGEIVQRIGSLHAALGSNGREKKQALPLPVATNFSLVGTKLVNYGSIPISHGTDQLNQAAKDSSQLTRSTTAAWKSSP
jgi:hypothetical protein